MSARYQDILWQGLIRLGCCKVGLIGCAPIAPRFHKMQIT